MPDTKQTPEVRYACYKQKRYQLKYLGTTKFGQRAHLAYLDGSKEFWVDADMVEMTDTNIVAEEKKAATVHNEASTWRPAMYKGYKYKLLWMGPTKFGQRARLAYMDGSKEFWVEADAVMVDNEELPPRTDQQPGAPAPSQRENRPQKATCPVCHEAPAEIEHPEHAGTLICGGCFLAIGSPDIPY